MEKPNVEMSWSVVKHLFTVAAVASYGLAAAQNAGNASAVFVLIDTSSMSLRNPGDKAMPTTLMTKRMIYLLPDSTSALELMKSVHIIIRRRWKADRHRGQLSKYYDPNYTRKRLGKWIPIPYSGTAVDYLVTHALRTTNVVLSERGNVCRAILLTVPIDQFVKWQVEPAR